MFTRELVLNEKMNIRINLSSFITLLAAIIAGVAGFYSLKADFDQSIIALTAKNENHVVELIRLERKFDASTHELHLVDENILKEQKEYRKEYSIVSSNTNARLSAIDAHLVWIVEDLKKD